jgi:hypothetical protein
MVCLANLLFIFRKLKTVNSLMAKNLAAPKNKTKKVKEKSNVREVREEDSYIPGAHFHNWINS